jgi:adenylate cyclase
MFTDTVGYTASTHTDEARTLELLREQEELMRPLISTHHGREIKSTGDGFLVEFDSALKATHCAVDIQRRIYERNAEGGLPPIQIRIGIHLGDVVQHGTDILGDAVNIAARIEPVAEPGGICLSGAVHDQVWSKITDKLEKLPPTVLKGLPVPMEIYRVVLPWTAREPPSAGSAPTGLAVLPFSNISPDPKDEYFADGLTEELITILSRLRGLRVIARTSVMQYKATTKAVSQIGTELRVSSVLEGSVRKAGNHLRVTVQLIDVGSEGHVWVQMYDRELDDVFAVQSDIAKQVAEALKVELRPTEQERLQARPKVRSDSYLAYLRGRTLLQGLTRTSLEAAKEQFELAISLDPKNAGAHSGLAEVTTYLGEWFANALPTEWKQTSRRLASRAVELDPSLADAHTSWAMILCADFEYAAAERELKVALSLNPSYSPAHRAYAVLLQDEGRADEALVEYALAEAADPLFSNGVGLWADLLIWLGRLDDALAKIRRFGELEGDSFPWLHYRLAKYHLARSEPERCLEEIHRGEELEPDRRIKRFWRAWFCALSGEKETARALLRQEEALPEFSLLANMTAWIYAELGDLDACFRYLEKLVQGHQIYLQQWRLDPRLENVRSDPRFQSLLKKMNLA